MRALTFLLLCAVIATTGDVAASDFWDEVRNPGQRVWREDVARARLALRARRFEDARDAANAAVARLPDRAEGYVVRALVAGELGALQDAHRDLHRAIEIDPTSLDDPLDAGPAAQLLARQGDLSTAVSVLGRVLSRMRDGHSRRILYSLYGDILGALGPQRNADAIRAYREALRGARRDPRATLGLALALRRETSDGVEWRDLARAVAARGRLEVLLANLPLSEAERQARRAVIAEAIGDEAAARAAWTAANTGPWAGHAAAQANEPRTR